MFALNQEWCIFCLVNVETETWGKKYYKIRPPARSFDGGPLPASVDIDVIHVINAPRPSPSISAYCKQSKTGCWEGLGTRLVLVYCIIAFVWSCSSVSDIDDVSCI